MFFNFLTLVARLLKFEILLLIHVRKIVRYFAALGLQDLFTCSIRCNLFFDKKPVSFTHPIDARRPLRLQVSNFRNDLFEVTIRHGPQAEFGLEVLKLADLVQDLSGRELVIGHVLNHPLVLRVINSDENTL